MSSESPLAFARARFRASCGDCGLRAACLPAGLRRSEIVEFDRIVVRGRRFDAGTSLYAAGDRVSNLYVLRSGTVKCCRTESGGAECVTGFLLEGDVVGLEEVAEERHRGSARALEAVEACVIVAGRLHALSERLPGLETQLPRVVSRRVAAQRRALSLTRGASVTDAVLALLRLLIDRADGALDPRPVPLTLRLPQADVASFLGVEPAVLREACRRLALQRSLVPSDSHVELRGPARLLARARRS
ncbi:MAG: cyclic nucleotide-binding domain-containing protein [Gammaproteobacteria bacterium]|nr:cyclic nucleotide-binding domain-containing protein [Gammaproteobacteria bacterium]